MKSGTRNKPINPVMLKSEDLRPADYYLYLLTETKTLTQNCEVGDIELNINSESGIVASDVVTIYEGERMFQNLVKTTDTGKVTIQAPVDFAFTANALVEFGKWNAAVNGSSEMQKFSIKSPPEMKFKIRTVNVSIIDNAAMYENLFGSLQALANGIQFRFDDGFVKNLATVVNNIGFWEIGFESTYPDKVPSGTYAFKARRNVLDVNGLELCLCSCVDEFIVNIQDNLTGLNLIDFTVNGYLERI